MSHICSAVFEHRTVARPSAAFQSFAQRTASPAFGQVFTDHMATARFDRTRGWYGLRIEPVAPVVLPPASSVFHYGQEIFEGLKAHRAPDGTVQLFRPWDNALRFLSSARRMCMAELPPELFVTAVAELVRQDSEWVPAAPESLYLRPLMIACDPMLGARAATQYLFTVIASPVGRYLGKDVSRVWVSTKYARATPGGTGAAKCGGNYAACLIAQAEAREHACDHVAFLDSVEHRWVEELGSMNIFFVFNDGSLRTPPLNGNILRGITRDSLITIAREVGHTVQEVPYALDEWIANAASGRLIEAFACGTAAGVVGIGMFVTADGDHIIGDGGEGPITSRLRHALLGVQQGTAADPHSWLQRLD